MKRPPKEPDRSTPLVKNQEYDRVYDWEIEHVEVIRSVQRRRRWSAEEKAPIVQETYAAGISVSLVALARDRAEPTVHLAPALRQRRAVGGRGRARRWSPPRNTGPCSNGCASCSGCWEEDLGERDPARGAG